MAKSYDRKIGFYPISIATSLAFEGLFLTGDYDDGSPDKTLKVKEKVDGKVLYVNIRTLFRNAYNAFPSETHPTLLLKPIIESLIEDILGIKQTLKQESPLKVVFYFCNYKSIDKELGKLNYYNRGEVSKETKSTPKQVMYLNLENDVFKNIDHIEEQCGVEIEEFDFYLESDDPIIVLTHIPIDLLSASKVPSLLLLESHTGKLKGLSEWGTKLNTKPKNVPFNKMTLSLFGDGVVIAPQPTAFRKAILKLGEKYKWDHRTSAIQIIEAAKRANEPHLVTFLRKYK